MVDLLYKTPQKNPKSPIPVKSSEFYQIANSKFFKNPNYKCKKLSLPDKIPRNEKNWILESPFCRLLNESEQEPFEKYQILGSIANNVTFFLLIFYQIYNKSSLLMRKKSVNSKLFSMVLTPEVRRYLSFL